MPESKESLSSEEMKPERYSLERVTIEALETAPELKGKMKEFSWPLELQGKGLSDEHDKTMLVKFPKGDIFLSFATTIHEVGHLRQEELDPKLKKKVQTHDNLLAQEQDAWSRGWKRFLKSCPDLFKSLEEKFQDCRRRGKLEDFVSFEDLYQWISKNVLSMVQVQDVLFDDAGEAGQKVSEKQFDAVAEKMEKIGIRDFLKEYEAARVGEIVDEEEMRKVIKSIIGDIIGE